MVPLSVNVSPELRRELEEQAKRLDVPLSQVVRWALGAWLENPEPFSRNADMREVARETP